MAEQFLPVLITLGAAVFTAVAIIGLAALVSQRSRHTTITRGEVYESGVEEGDLRLGPPQDLRQAG
jgi:NADH:ubiquinone oxidoreductase subunit 3 (subunit A)